ncbi:MAG: ABC transporter permease subunit, partial [Halobacteriales archaeon]
AEIDECIELFPKRLNPLGAFRVLSSAALDADVSAVPELPLEDVPATVPPEQLALANRLAGEVPWYLQDWMSVVVLVAWGVVPVALGYWRFTRVDLG